MNELLRLSLTDLAERLRARRASPVELMEAVLARIAATQPDLNAFTVLRERGGAARRRARRRDAHRARRGTRRSKASRSA